MRNKGNPLTETICITLTSDRAKKKPLFISIKKYVMFSLVFLFVAAAGIGAYAGVSAYFAVSKLSDTVDDLRILVAWQAANNTEGSAMLSEVEMMKSERDWFNLAPVSGDEVSAAESDDAARMSDPWLEVVTTEFTSSVELQSGNKNGRVELISWFDGGSQVFPRLQEALIIDVETGMTFNARRISGSYHADSEPLTAADAAVIKQLYGGGWSWDRRAIWVKIDDRYFAASMNGMPHSSNYNSSNNFNGHFCIHFFQSRVHETSAICPVHQNKIVESYSKAEILDEYIKLIEQ